jgi:hypothetical protein
MHAAADDDAHLAPSSSPYFYIADADAINISLLFPF